MYLKINRIAHRHGWNLAIHGSMLRDLDLVLIPWTDDAEHIDKVIDAIRFFVDGKYIQKLREKNNKKNGVTGNTGLSYYHVTEKPHGRKAISIYIGASGYYLDISIMPRIEKNT